MILQNIGARIAKFAPFRSLYLDSNMPPDFSNRLSNDILLEIAYFLSVPELLALRSVSQRHVADKVLLDNFELQVSRRFCAVTYSPVIWKRLLKNTDMQLPPLPPTINNSYRNIKSEVCEQVVRRAHAVEHEWQRSKCRPAHNFIDSMNPTHSLAIVPGGRFLAVASTNHSTQQSFLTVWDLEVPAKQPFLPNKRRAALVRTSLPGSVLEMSSSYLPYKGQQGVAIAVVGFVENFSNKLVFSNDIS